MKLTSPIKRRLLLAGLAVLLIGLFFFVMLRSGPLAPIKVTVAQVKQGSIAPELFGIGTVEARRNWMIGPTVAGRVLNVKVDVGDTVKAGQLLAEMDPVDIDQRLASLDAAIERARSTQTAAAAQQADAVARRALAVSTMRRNQDLADQHFISSGALESFTQTKASADAALDAARANATGAAQDLNRAKADRAALLQQRANVRLIAPSDGVVSARDAEPGSTVVAGQSVLRLIDPSSLWVKLRVDQGRSGGLAQGLKARIVLRSQPQTSIPGTVDRVELLGDSVTEERIAQVAFEKAPVGMSVGEMAEATIQLPSISVLNVFMASNRFEDRDVVGAEFDAEFDERLQRFYVEMTNQGLAVRTIQDRLELLKHWRTLVTDMSENAELPEDFSAALAEAIYRRKVTIKWLSSKTGLQSPMPSTMLALLCASSTPHRHVFGALTSCRTAPTCASPKS